MLTMQGAAGMAAVPDVWLVMGRGRAGAEVLFSSRFSRGQRHGTDGSWDGRTLSPARVLDGG
jgi:hypothetical protein